MFLIDLLMGKKKAEANDPDSNCTPKRTNTRAKYTPGELVLSSEVYADLEARAQEALRFARHALVLTGDKKYDLAATMIRGAQVSNERLIDALGQMEVLGGEGK